MSKEFPALIDAGVVKVTALLIEAGFRVTDALAFVDNYGAEEDIVTITCSAENLIAESHRLLQLIRARVPTCDGCLYGVDASYDPATGRAELELWGVSDSLIEGA